MIDDDPAPSSQHTGATPGPEEEMRGSLEDTHAIRSPQVSRLLFTPCSSSLSLFFFLCVYFLLAFGGGGDRTGVRVPRNDASFLPSVTLSRGHEPVCASACVRKCAMGPLSLDSYYCYCHVSTSHSSLMQFDFTQY